MIEINAIENILTDLGFPAITAYACFYYIKELSKRQENDKDKLFKIISESTEINENLTTAITNLSNSISMQNEAIKELTKDITEIKKKIEVNDDSR